MLSIFSCAQWTCVFLSSENGLLWGFVWFSLGSVIFYFGPASSYCKLRDRQLSCILKDIYLCFIYILWLFLTFLIWGEMYISV